MNKRVLAFTVPLLILIFIIAIYIGGQFNSQGPLEPSETVTPTIPSPAPKNFTPFGIHITFARLKPLTLNFIWITASPTNNSIVELSKPDGDVIRYNGSQIFYKKFYWHIVSASNLALSNKYEYRVGDPDIEMSPKFILWLGSNNTNFNFTVYGDQGTNKYSRMVVQTSVKFNPMFNIHVGDLSYGGSRVDQWIKWFNIIEPLASTRPYLIAVGNHEYDGAGDLSDLNIYFPSIDSKYNYWFIWGNSFFLVINPGPYDDALLDSTLYDWVNQSLRFASMNPNIKWIFVFVHYPPYSSGASHGSSKITEPLKELFDLYGVDIVFSGHEHNYERTYPLKHGSIMSYNDSLYINPNGTIYIVVGGAGGGLYKSFIEPKPAWSYYREARYSFGVIIVNENKVIFRAIDAVNGTVFDEFTLIKK